MRNRTEANRKSQSLLFLCFCSVKYILLWKPPLDTPQLWLKSVSWPSFLWVDSLPPQKCQSESFLYSILITNSFLYLLASNPFSKHEFLKMFILYSLTVYFLSWQKGVNLLSHQKRRLLFHLFSFPRVD